MEFKTAVEQTPHLKKAYREGLQALRPQDKPHIEAEDPRKLLGSVDVDKALQKVDPQGNRWDFGIAYQHTNHPEEFVYWTELHTASNSQVKKVIKKAQWLLRWLKEEGHRLAAFDCKIIWVSSGATSFNLTGFQQKQMALVGLRHVGSKLRIRNQH